MDLEQDLCSQDSQDIDKNENLMFSLFFSEIAFLGASFYNVISKGIDKFSYVFDWHSYFNY